MTPIERAATIIDREYGPCNDDVNHRGTEAHYAAEALADAGLLLTDEDRAVLEAAERWETELNRPKAAHASYSAARRVAAVDALEAAVRARREAQR